MVVYVQLNEIFKQVLCPSLAFHSRILKLEYRQHFQNLSGAVLIDVSIFGRCISFRGSFRNRGKSEKVSFIPYALKLNNGILTVSASFKLHIVKYVFRDLTSLMTSLWCS